MTGNGMKATERKRTQSLFDIVWRTYIKSALMPIVLIELVLIGCYLLSNHIIRNENIEMMTSNARQNLQESARQEANIVGAKLGRVNELAGLFASMTQRAFQTPFDPGPKEKARYALSPDGVWYTRRDLDGTALFYSSRTHVGMEQMKKAWQMAQLDPLMKYLVDGSQLVTQAYLNTYDSMNRIYPYFDVLSQYPADLDIPKYNFYYQADAKHNVSRGVVWTDVYKDPAGQGWMTSAIAPVYRKGGDFLEGVVGLDVKVTEIIEHILALQIPWSGYAMLVDSRGTILAMPKPAEKDWGLTELTDRKYQGAITENQFKPAGFNIFKRADTQELAQKLDTQPRGVVDLRLAGKRKLASWSVVPLTGWRLLVLADEESLFADANQLKLRFDHFGFLMIGALVLFYLVFMLLLYRRSRRLSKRIAAPIWQMQQMITAIGNGEYQQPQPRFDVLELNDISQGLVKMGGDLQQGREQLDEVNASLRQLNLQLESRVQERTQALADANEQLRHEKQAQAELIDELRSTQAQLVQSEKMASIGQLAAGVAHEINNPLAFVSSNIQCFKDYANDLIALQCECEALLDPALRKRTQELRERHQYALISEELPELVDDSLQGVLRIKKIVNSLREFAQHGSDDWQWGDLNACVEAALTLSRNRFSDRVNLKVDLRPLPKVRCIPSQLHQVALTLLINAAQAVEEGGEVIVQTGADDTGGWLTVADNGCGIPKGSFQRIFDPFYTTREVGKGVGMGLAIAYRVVSAHRGKIDVESEEGKGSRFQVRLPLDLKDPNGELSVAGETEGEIGSV